MLKPLNIKRFYTDDWGAYERHIPAEKHEIGKRSTHSFNLLPAKDRQEEFLVRLNEVFITDNLSDKDLINYSYTVRDKLAENTVVMSQIINNSPEQAMLGDFPQAIDDAILGSSEAHQEQLLSDVGKNAKYE